MRHMFVRGFVLLALFAGFAAQCVAEEMPYREGAVVSMTFIRTKYGSFEQYMKFLAAQWKPLHEAAKKDGLIVSYRVIAAPPANRDDWNLLLIVEYKNMAALDGLDEKMRGLVEKMIGSIEKAEEQATERGVMREVLGDKLGREFILK